MALTDNAGREEFGTEHPLTSLGEAPDVDVTIPSPARMYDYYLGGKDNYPADRLAAGKALTAVPCGRQVAWANRKFLVRAVKCIARRGIDQFIDLGTGIPTSPNVHEVARSVNPGATVAYVDNDPIVVVHDGALLAGSGEYITAVRGDVRYPLNIITNHTVRQVIDFSRPVGILFVAVLHFITDEENPYDSVAAFRDRMRPGSHIVISHITSDGSAPNTIRSIQEAYRTATAPAVFRTREQIEKLFSGFELLKPGLVEVSGWRGNNRKPAVLPALRFLGGVGRKP
jgi:S-adenosyl methyltransferase